MNWMEKLKADPLPWLLEDDRQYPSVRYLTLTNILDSPPDYPEVESARLESMRSGLICDILAAQDPEGWWDQPGAGYYPKYTGTVWQLTFLAQMGADGTHPQIRLACDHVLDNNRSANGGFSIDGRNSGIIQCLAGNLGAAIIALGMFGDQRLEEALDWLARSVTGEGIATSEHKKAPVRYLRSGNSGPGFLCSANNHLPCAWGAVKAMLALIAIPEADRNEIVNRAIETGAQFLLSRDPAEADYPMGYSSKPNRSWFKFGFPVAYVTDVLQNLEVLTSLGYGSDERLAPALQMLLDKQDSEGKWPMEYTYNGKMWVDIEVKGKPSKWVTYRAMKVLKQASP